MAIRCYDVTIIDHFARWSRQALLLTYLVSYHNIASVVLFALWSRIKDSRWHIFVTCHCCKLKFVMCPTGSSRIRQCTLHSVWSVMIFWFLHRKIPELHLCFCIYDIKRLSNSSTTGLLLVFILVLFITQWRLTDHVKHNSMLSYERRLWLCCCDVYSLIAGSRNRNGDWVDHGRTICAVGQSAWWRSCCKLSLWQEPQSQKWLYWKSRWCHFQVPRLGV